MKASKQKEEFTYEIRDIVLAKIRGYPSWPAMVRRVNYAVLGSWFIENFALPLRFL